jgi:hypothetical protein
MTVPSRSEDETKALVGELGGAIMRLLHKKLHRAGIDPHDPGGEFVALCAIMSAHARFIQYGRARVDPVN